MIEKQLDMIYSYPSERVNLNKLWHCGNPIYAVSLVTHSLSQIE